MALIARRKVQLNILTVIEHLQDGIGALKPLFEFV
jgi:hypothetical protein